MFINQEELLPGAGQCEKTVIQKGNEKIPINEASRRWVRMRIWSVGVMVPIFTDLVWILRILVMLEAKITSIVPPSVFTMDEPFPVLTWSRILIIRFLKGGIFTIGKRENAPCANTRVNNNWIMLFHQCEYESPSSPGLVVRIFSEGSFENPKSKSPFKVLKNL